MLNFIDDFSFFKKKKVFQDLIRLLVVAMRWNYEEKLLENNK